MCSSDLKDGGPGGPRSQDRFERVPQHYQLVSFPSLFASWRGTENFYRSTFAVSSPSAASASALGTSRPLSLGVIFLTLYIDLIGFSIAFPLAPRMLEYYLAKESSGGPLGWLQTHIQALAPTTSANPIFVAALFGGVVSGLYGFLQFLFAPI